MQVHELKPNHKERYRKIVGRGGKKGTYSGKGGKGQTARAGRKLAPIIRELIKRYPKLKGYRAFVPDDAASVVSLSLLEKHFKDGETVNPEILVIKKLVRNVGGKTPLIKILGNGTLSRKLNIVMCKVSASAKVAIEKAGGTIK